MMKKVLFVLGKWSNGGIEKMIYTYCHELIPRGYSVDIFAFEKDISVFTDKLENIGVNIFSPKKKIKGGYIKHNIERLSAFLQATDSDYDIVHYNTAFAIAYIHCAFLKKKNKKVKIILHSHGEGINEPYVKMKNAFNSVIKRVFQKVPDYCLACSDASGQWLYSKVNFNSKHYLTIMNAIDFESNKFNPVSREKYRAEWKIDEKQIVIGTVGRFSYQKNPFFILEIIEQLAKAGTDYKFIWIGTGEEKAKIKNQVKSKGLEQYIIFIDHTPDIAGCLSGFDIMILPSRYEGLPLILLEAQASGLLTLVSDAIPKIAKITDRLVFLPIDKVNSWVEAITCQDTAINNREYPMEEIEKSQFKIEQIMDSLIEIYEHK